jgi:hypothetical protein
LDKCDTNSERRSDQLRLRIFEDSDAPRKDERIYEAMADADASEPLNVGPDRHMEAMFEHDKESAVSSRVVTPFFSKPFHSGLVRQVNSPQVLSGEPSENKALPQGGRHFGFDQVYEVVETVGHGGICTVYKIRKRDHMIGGSSRASNVRAKPVPVQDISKKFRFPVKSLRNIVSLLQKRHEQHKRRGGRIPGPSKAPQPVTARGPFQAPALTLVEPRIIDVKKREPAGGLFFALKVINVSNENNLEMLRNEVAILKVRVENLSHASHLYLGLTLFHTRRRWIIKILSTFWKRLKSEQLASIISK